MIGIGFSEIMVVALVCLVVLGPKDLPVVMRKLAGFYRKFVGLRDELRFQILSVDHQAKPVAKAEENNGSPHG